MDPIQIIVQAVDQTAPVLQGIAQQVVQLGSSVQNVQTQIAGLATALSPLTGADLSGLVQQFTDIVSQVNNLNQSLQLTSGIAGLDALSAKVSEIGEQLAQLQTSNTGLPDPGQGPAAPGSAPAPAAPPPPSPVPQNAVPDLLALANALKLSYDEADKLAGNLGLDADKITAAVSTIRQLTAVQASADTQFRQLNATLGVSEAQFEELSKAAKEAAARTDEATKHTESESNLLIRAFRGFHELVADNEIVKTAFAFNQVTGAIGELQHLAHPIFENLIAQNIELRQQIQGVAAQLAATQDIKVGGVVQTDSVQAIKAALGPVQEQVKQLQKDALQLVGVTSTELVGAFQVLAQQSSTLGVNLAQAEKLTISLEAAATTLGLPLQQAQQEIQGIGRGEITNYNQLAKSLGLNNERLRTLEAQGKLYEYITQKAAPLVKGQELAATSFAGVTSNLREIVQLVTQAAGAPLLDILVEQLNKVFEFLKENQKNLEDFGVSAVNTILGIVKPLLEAFGPTLGNLVEATAVTFQALLEVLQAVAPIVVALGLAIAQLAEILSAAVKVVAQIAEVVASELHDPVVVATVAIVALTIAINAGLIPAILNLIRTQAAGFFLGMAGNVAKLAAFVPGLAAEMGTLATSLSGVGAAIAACDFAAAAAGLGTLALAAAAVLAPLALVAAGVAAIVAIRMAKDMQESRTALEEYGKTTDQISQQSIGLAQKLAAAKKEQQEATKQGFNLSDKELARIKQLNEASKGQVKAIDDQIAELKQLKPVGEENKRNLESQIAELEKMRSTLNGLANDVKFQNKALPELGDTFQQLDDKAKAYVKTIASPVDNAKLEEASKGLIENTKQQFELGKLTADQAKERLEAIANDKRLEVATQQAAQKELTDLLKKEGDDRVADVKAHEEEEQALIASGQVGKFRGDQQLTELKKQELDTQLANTKEALEREQREGRGDGEKAKELVRQEKELQSKLTEEEEKGEEERRKQRLHEFDEQQTELQSNLDSALLGQRQFNEKSLELTKGRIEEELKQLEEKKARLSPDDAEGLKELTTKEAQLRGELAKKTEDYYKKQSELRTKFVSDESTENDSLYARKLETEEEYNQKSLALTKEKIAAELQELARERNRLAPGDLEGREALNAKQAALEKQLFEAEEKVATARYQAKVRHFDDTQKLLESALATGKETETQFNEASLANTRKRLDTELAEVARKRSQLKSGDKQALEDLATQEAEIHTKQERALEEYEGRRIAVVERAEKKATEIIQAAETERLIQVAQLENSLAITHAEAEQLRVDETSDRIKKEIALERDKVTQLAALPKLSDPAKQEERESQIRASKLKTAQLTKDLIDSEQKQREAAVKVYEDGIDRELKARKSADAVEERSLTREKQLQDGVTQSLDQQKRLLDSQKELTSSLTSYYEGELGILQKTAKTDAEKKQLAETTAAVKLKAAERQAVIEQQLLELSIRQKEEQLEQEKIQLRLETIAARRATRQAQAELKKIEAKARVGQATAEDVQEARDKLDDTVDNQVALVAKGQVLEQKGVVNEEEARSQRIAQQQKTNLNLDQARSDFAESRVDPNDKKRDTEALADEIKQRLFGGTGDVSGQLRPFAQAVESESFVNSRGEALSRGPAIAPTFGAELDRLPPTLTLPQAPNLDAIRAQIQANLPNVNAGADAKLSKSLERLEAVLTKVQSPTVNQTNQVTNNFTAGDVASGDLEKQVRQQSINAQMEALKLLQG